MNEITIGDYRVTLNTSIFTKRNNSTVKFNDITVQVTDERNYGAYINGRYYNQVCIFAAEDGRVIRGTDSTLPSYVTEIVDGLVE